MGDFLDEGKMGAMITQQAGKACEIRHVEGVK